MWKHNQPLSALYFSDRNTFGLALKCGFTLKLVEIHILKDHPTKSKYDMEFYKFGIASYVEAKLQLLPPLDESADVEYCLLLPEINENGYLGAMGENYYYVINSSWMEYKKGKFHQNIAIGMKMG